MEEIYRNNWEKAIYKIMEISSWIKNSVNQHFKNHDITFAQYYLLKTLKNSPKNQCSIKELKEKSIQKDADISRLVSRLYEKELVTKKTHNEDKRLTLIKLTKSGKILVKQISEQAVVLDRILYGISKKELKTLLEILEKMKEN